MRTVWPVCLTNADRFAVFGFKDSDISGTDLVIEYIEYICDIYSLVVFRVCLYAWCCVLRELRSVLSAVVCCALSLFDPFEARQRFTITMSLPHAPVPQLIEVEPLSPSATVMEDEEAPEAPAAGAAASSEPPRAQYVRKINSYNPDHLESCRQHLSIKTSNTDQ